MSTVIYHNPHCSKSRQTLEILQKQDINPEIIEYLKTPPTEAELSTLLELLGIPAREIVRSGEEEYKQLGLDDPNMTDTQIIQALVSTPKLIERPIVVRNGQAVIGRPPKKVLDLL
ncbi:MAG: arsenate reductase (glutaredoxin) [Thiohalomonadales bacterium]